MPAKQTRQPVIALLYDFDKTLSTRDMQEYTFIPELGMSAKEFWEESNQLTQDEKMDGILAYMYLMICKSKSKNLPIRREDFVKQGRDIQFFPGVEDWFGRMEAFGREQGVKIEHYLISSGLKEIIEGSKIKGNFKEIYACEFHYDASGVADWPRMVVNYTTKTQFLFRINKGSLDISDDDTVNRYVPEDDRPVPFRNMVYFGDGITDVPCMKLVKTHGGKSIAVYQKQTRPVAAGLLRDDRVDYIAPADYSEGGELCQLVQEIICQEAATDALIRKSRKQKAKV